MKSIAPFLITYNYKNNLLLSLKENYMFAVYLHDPLTIIFNENKFYD